MSPRRGKAVPAPAEPAALPPPAAPTTARDTRGGGREPTPPRGARLGSTGRRGSLPSSPPDGGLSPGRGGGGGAHPDYGDFDGDGEDAAAAAAAHALMDAVIKVFATHAEPNYSLPWQRRRQAASTSSGFIIPGRRLLTNAHCVEHATSVKVRRRGAATKFAARILAIGAECDLALLEVADPAFWEGDPPAVTLSREAPHLQTRVVAAGFPLGGDTLSTNAGIISRLEVQPYTHGSADLLAATTDAAINSGASGGAVFDISNGACVGVSFQSMAGSGEAENIGHVIPVTPIVTHFLDDYERHGRYTGFPVIGLEWQRLESPSTRAALGMAPGQTGVYVRRVDSTAPVAAAVAAGDVLLSVDGTHIGNDGTVPFRQGERLAFSYLISCKFVGDAVTLATLRDGKPRRVRVALAAPARLAPVHLGGRLPSYAIFGGLAFTPLSIPFLRSEYGRDYEAESPLRLLELATGWSAAPRRHGEQAVVLSQVLASDAAADTTSGLEDFANVRVAAIDGVKIDSMATLVATLAAGAARARAARPGTPARFMRLDLDYGQRIYVDAAAADAATPGVLATHSIEHALSADLREEVAKQQQKQKQKQGRAGVDRVGGGRKKARR